MSGPRRLLKWRKKEKLSQEKLAALVGVSQETVSRWEAGESSPILKFAIRMAKLSNEAVPVDCWVTTEKRTAAA